MIRKINFVGGLLVFLYIVIFSLMFIGQINSQYTYFSFKVMILSATIEWIILFGLLYFVRKKTILFAIPAAILSQGFGMIYFLLSISIFHSKHKFAYFYEAIKTIDLGFFFELFVSSLVKGSFLIGPIVMIFYKIISRKNG